ncbi:MAG: DUF2478 domain-containing protein [Planctomycetes bacterium]|nr:DUF2478 domain-containing protein [Planctomycetota bacterium]
MLYVLTGPVRCGKTTLLEQVVRELQNLNVHIDGFLSKAVMEQGNLAGYDLFDLQQRKAGPFIRREGEASWERSGAFFFQPQGIEQAMKIVHRARQADLTVIDEIGPLELKGKGIWPAIEPLLGQESSSALVIVRERILEKFLERFPKQRSRVFPVEENGIEVRMVRVIGRDLNKTKGET